ncbi:MAG: glutamate racemase [Bdellovibrionales bacterium RBG_16_40_8]|nr:MAG: glutamate racemase [Bdellovibrionales bacterium RBG_16_40_8]
MSRRLMASASNPIGIFDSGIGGLTVLKALREKLPHENFLYLGDTARIPYGTKSPQTIKKYLEQNLKYLAKQNVKAVVIACNSASSVAEEINFSLPIYDVISPGSRLAVEASKACRIGVIATKATVLSKSYVTHIQKIKPHVQVYQQASSLLVPLVEEGWDDDPVTNLIVYRYISPLLKENIDTLVLGCTHYPILKPAIRKVVGANVTLIDSGFALAKKLTEDLQQGVIMANSKDLTGEIRLLTTDSSDTFQANAKRIMLPLEIKPLEIVDIN